MMIASIVTCLFAADTYAYTSEMTNGVPPAAPVTAQPTHAQIQPGAGAQTAIAPSVSSAKSPVAEVVHKTTKKKSWSNFFGIFDFIGRLESFVKGRSKQNENVIDEASNGVFKQSHKRAIAVDPAARRVQEKMDKAQAEHLSKLDKVVGE